MRMDSGFKLYTSVIIRPQTYLLHGDNSISKSVALANYGVPISGLVDDSKAQPNRPRLRAGGWSEGRSNDFTMASLCVVSWSHREGRSMPPTGRQSRWMPLSITAIALRYVPAASPVSKGRGVEAMLQDEANLIRESHVLFPTPGIS